MRTDRYKLIHFYDTDEFELFDVAKDPQEMASVYSDASYALIVRDDEGRTCQVKSPIQGAADQTEKEMMRVVDPAICLEIS